MNRRFQYCSKRWGRCKAAPSFSLLGSLPFLECVLFRRENKDLYLVNGVEFVMRWMRLLYFMLSRVPLFCAFFLQLRRGGYGCPGRMGAGCGIGCGLSTVGQQQHTHVLCGPVELLKGLVDAPEGGAHVFQGVKAMVDFPVPAVEPAHGQLEQNI